MFYTTFICHECKHPCKIEVPADDVDSVVDAGYCPFDGDSAAWIRQDGEAQE